MWGVHKRQCRGEKKPTFARRLIRGKEEITKSYHAKHEKGLPWCWPERLEWDSAAWFGRVPLFIGAKREEEVGIARADGQVGEM